MLVDDAGAELRVVAATGASVPPDQMDRVAVGAGVAGVVFAAGEAVAVGDLDADARFASRVRRARYTLEIARGGAGPRGRRQRSACCAPPTATAARRSARTSSR